MIQYLLTFVIIVSTYLIYHLIIKPIRIMNYYSNHFSQKGFRVKKLPYNPLGSPSIQITIDDNQKGDSFVTYKTKFNEYDVIVSNFLNKPEILLLHPQLINEMGILENDFIYSKQKMLLDSLATVLGYGLGFSQKKIWKHKRTMFSQIFNFKFVQNKIPEIIKICDETFKKLELQSEQNKDKKFKYPLFNFTSSITSEVILRCFIGGEGRNAKINQKPIAIFLIDLINDLALRAIQPATLILGPKVLKLGFRQKDRKINQQVVLLQAWENNFVQEMIQKIGKQNKNENNSPNNIVEAILISNKGLPESQRTSPASILDDFKQFFLAGTDTSAHFLQMMIYYLWMNQQVLQTLRKEIDLIMSEEDYSYQNLKKLVYLEAVQKQTTRMYGPVNFNFHRIVQKDHEIGNVKIFKDTFMRYHSIPLHYNPQIYEEPFKFRPERWLNDETKNNPAHTLVGFGIASRSCIGKQLALLETKIALVKFLKRYQSYEVLTDKIELKTKFLYVPERYDTQVVLKVKHQI